MPTELVTVARGDAAEIAKLRRDIARGKYASIVRGQQVGKILAESVRTRRGTLTVWVEWDTGNLIHLSDSGEPMQVWGPGETAPVAPELPELPITEDRTPEQLAADGDLETDAEREPEPGP
jgi:hypothetical protein